MDLGHSGRGPQGVSGQTGQGLRLGTEQLTQLGSSQWTIGRRSSWDSCSPSKGPESGGVGEHPHPLTSKFFALNWPPYPISQEARTQSS